MPNLLFGDSSDGTQPALLVQNTGSDNGLLIVGLKRSGGNAFQVLNNGQVWAPCNLYAFLKIYKEGFQAGCPQTQPFI
jgi:hypothetical protein